MAEFGLGTPVPSTPLPPACFPSASAGLPGLCDSFPRAQSDTRLGCVSDRPPIPTIRPASRSDLRRLVRTRPRSGGRSPDSLAPSNSALLASRRNTLAAGGRTGWPVRANRSSWPQPACGWTNCACSATTERLRRLPVRLGPAPTFVRSPGISASASEEPRIWSVCGVPKSGLFGCRTRCGSRNRWIAVMFWSASSIRWPHWRGCRGCWYRKTSAAC